MIKKTIDVKILFRTLVHHIQEVETGIKVLTKPIRSIQIYISNLSITVKDKKLR